MSSGRDNQLELVMQYVNESDQKTIVKHDNITVANIFTWTCISSGSDNQLELVTQHVDEYNLKTIVTHDSITIINVFT